VNITDLLAELSASPKLPGAACRGRWKLYDSADADDVASAQRICAGCPALQACRQWVETSPQRLHGYVVAGVVQRKVKRERKPPPVPPMSVMRRRALAAIAAANTTGPRQR
jgi:Transcription factor WhiB